MRAARIRLVLGILALSVLAACGGKRQAALRDTGPDEFAIVPNRPLQLPESYAVLPQPVRGASNLADPRPEADAVAALGGNPARLNAGAVPAGDRGIVQTASRYGVASDIRRVLAEEDARAKPRKPRRRQAFSKILKRKARAYRRMVLDPHAETERFRRAGVRTPAAPPANLR